MDAFKEAGEVILAAVIRQSSAIGVESELKSNIRGLEELKLSLYDTATNIALETSNVLASNHGCTVALRELQPARWDSTKQTTCKMTMGNFHIIRPSPKRSTRPCGNRSDICIPLYQAGDAEGSGSFGALIATVKCDEYGHPDPKSIEATCKLAQAISARHADQLREFVSLVTSLLLSPTAIAAPDDVPPAPARTHPEPSPPPLSTALAPLCSNLHLPGPLPIISLLTLRFQEDWLEDEYHEWKAEAMRKVDPWCIAACSSLVAFGLPMTITGACWAAFLLSFTLLAISSSRVQMLNSFYRRNRDKVLMMAALAVVAVQHICGGHLAFDARLFTMVSLFLPVRLTWHTPQLVGALLWRMATLSIRSYTSQWAFYMEYLRLFAGLVLAPWVLVYILEVVARRGFLSRQALIAAEAGEDEDDEWWVDEHLDEYDLN